MNDRAPVPGGDFLQSAGTRRSWKGKMAGKRQGKACFPRKPHFLRCVKRKRGPGEAPFLKGYSIGLFPYRQSREGVFDP